MTPVKILLVIFTVKLHKLHTKFPYDSSTNFACGFHCKIIQISHKISLWPQ